jgi:hypothetical protein
MSGAMANPIGAQARNPINLLRTKGLPPTVKGVAKQKTSNPRGLNRGGRVNTNIPMKQTTDEGSRILNRTFNLQG